MPDVTDYVAPSHQEVHILWMIEQVSFTSLAAAAASTTTLRSLMEEFIARVNMWHVCWVEGNDVMCVIYVYTLQ